MIRKTLHAGLACGAVVLSLGFATAVAEESVPAAESESGTRWFVELSGMPLADGNALNSVRSEKAAFRKAASAARIRYKERLSFDTLFNGFTVEVAAPDRARLAALPGVRAIYPVELVQAPLPEKGTGAAPDLAAALAMTGADIVQSVLGYTGAGIRVAVLDSGIDIDHPDLGGSGVNGSTPFPSARVTHGYDFVGDAFDANPANPTYNPAVTPDDNPDDCAGHGTHVAGIIGANGAIMGVAPGVTFGAYRVFGCNGSTTTEIILAAMERAFADGNQILNISIGSPYQWPQYPTAMAASRLVNKGMVVVASIGNNGPNGLYAAGAPGVGARVIGTASFDNLIASQVAFSVTPEGELIGFNVASGSPAPPVSGSVPIARSGTTAAADDGCNILGVSPFATGQFTDQAVLIRRGTCSFHEKAMNAQVAGAAAIVLYNNTTGALSPTVAGDPPVTIPVVAISQADGTLLDGKIQAGVTTVNWGTWTVSTPLANGGLISSFSSYGLAPDLALKPDIGAPGGGLFSTYPVERGSYASLDGTSMSSPHVAGAAALLLQARPNTSPWAVRDILQNSADPQAWSGNPGLGFLDNVHRQGAGMLDIDDAILATTRVHPAKLAVGASQAGPATRALTIRNRSHSPASYRLSSVNALSTGPDTFTPTFFLSNASVAFSPDSVTVPAHGHVVVQAAITPATSPAGGQYGGYIVLTDADDASSVFRVPFAGYIGDYQARQVLVPTVNGFPWLAQLVGTSYFNRPAGSTFTMVGDDLPYFLLHLDHQSRRLRMVAFDAVTGRSWHRVSDDQYLPRNTGATSYFAFSWNGSTFKGKGKNDNQWHTVPDGQYVVKISVLKALGDENNPAHWESWTSPVITIDRP